MKGGREEGRGERREGQRGGVLRDGREG